MLGFGPISDEPISSSHEVNCAGTSWLIQILTFEEIITKIYAATRPFITRNYRYASQSAV